ncbi:hypothetical protein ABEP17_07865 [Priestia flexa]|uniref:hypothetical protein n=1 Tax=Priestia flexa TaxID=86664 RepID=UPI003D27D689
MQKNFKELSEKLNSLNGIEGVLVRHRSRLLDNLLIEKIRDFNLVSTIERKFNISKNNATFFLYGWNQYYLYRTNIPFFKKAKRVILIEEGANAYLYPQPGNLSMLIKKAYGMNSKFLQKDKVESIYVQFPDNYSKLMNLNKKVKLLNLNYMVGKLDIKDKSDILNLFLTNEVKNKIEQQIISNKSITIVLTQPLSEDGYEDEKTKMKYYKEIIQQEENSLILLKQHPRETTNYNFNNVVILDKNFPSELLSFFNFQFDKAIGICTSAIYQINAKTKVNIYEDYFSKK